MDQLRIYTLRTAEALDRYATVHWPRHVASMPAFGATVRGVWTERRPGARLVVALLSLQDGVDPDEFTAAYVASPEFASDMEGFDLSDILRAKEVRLDPVPKAPMGEVSRAAVGVTARWHGDRGATPGWATGLRSTSRSADTRFRSSILVSPQRADLRNYMRVVRTVTPFQGAR